MPFPILFVTSLALQIMHLMLKLTLVLTLNFLRNVTSIPAIKCPFLTIPTFKSKYILCIAISPVKLYRMIQVAALTENRYVQLTAVRIPLATLRVALAALTKPLATRRAALATWRNTANARTAVSAICNTACTPFLKIQQAAFFATHTGFGIPQTVNV